MHPSPLRIVCRDHAGKGLPLARALADAGHLIVPNQALADVVLIDLDAPEYGYRDFIDFHKDLGAKVLLYPHGGGPVLVYDALYEPYERVDANLVIGPGQAELMRRLDYPRATHAIGWMLCDQRPFRPAGDVRHVLFAPTHPNGDGSMRDADRAANAEVFAELVRGPWHVTVRHLGTLEQNGLWAADGVTFTRADMRVAHEEIDAADAVVAGSGTFPSLAVARGVPTVIYAQSAAPDFGHRNAQVKPLRRTERYLDYVRYPFDAGDGALAEVVHAAARSEQPIAEWKRRFVGSPMNGPAVAALIENIVAGRQKGAAVESTGAFTVVGFADEIRERPELLAAYAGAFAPEDDVTLALWGPGLDEPTLLAMAEHAIAASGVDESRLPDVLLLPLPDAMAADELLAERARAVLSEWPPVGRVGELPRFGAADGAALAAAAGLVSA